MGCGCNETSGRRIVRVNRGGSQRRSAQSSTTVYSSFKHAGYKAKLEPIEDKPKKTDKGKDNAKD